MIKQLKKPETTEHIFGKPGVDLDFDRLTVAGHSFGGMTTLKVAASNKDVKASVVLDPWYFYKSDKLEKEAPDAACLVDKSKTLIIHTTTFPAFSDKVFKGQYDQKKCLQNFAKMSLAKGG